MKIIVNIKTEKENKSMRKDVNKSVDIIKKIIEFVELKLKGRMKEVKCYRDGAGVVLEK